MLVDHNILKHSSLNNWLLTRDKQIVKFHPKNTALESSSLVFLHEMACQGRGIALLPYYLCASSIKKNQLVMVLPDWMVPNNQYYLIYHKEKSTRYINQLFKDFILNSSLKNLLAPDQD